MPGDAKLEDWIWVGFCHLVVVLIILSALFHLIRLFSRGDPKVLNVIGGLFVTAALGILAVSYYDYARGGGWASTVVIAALVAGPVWLIGEVLILANQPQRRSIPKGDA